MTSNLAILAPIPLEHLESGKLICDETGFVAYGSKKFEFFVDVDKQRKGLEMPVFIYASDVKPLTHRQFATWYGKYIGFVHADRGAHPEAMKHRPGTTRNYDDDNANSYWHIFWHITELQQLPTESRIPIQEFQTRSGVYRNNAPPRGPEFVRIPLMQLRTWSTPIYRSSN